MYCGFQLLPAPLEKDEEEKLLAVIGKEDDDSWVRTKLIEHNLRLVIYIAKKFEYTGAGIEELVSVGTLGLVKGVNSFNPDKKIRLATYISRCIENEILLSLRYVRKRRMEISFEEALSMRKSGSGFSLTDIFSKKNGSSGIFPEENAEQIKLYRAIGRLSLREQMIVSMRFGFSSDEGRMMSQKEMAQILGVSQSYFSRIERRIIRRLRSDMVESC